MSRPILPPGIIPLGATHFYFDAARIKPATNPWRRLDSDGTWHMLVGAQWNRIAASRRHMFVAVTDGVSAERVAHVELASESLTLRDYFAAKAMQAAMSNEALVQRILDSTQGAAELEGKYLAETAYRVADEMMRARQ
jgi:hypothetical protein